MKWTVNSARIFRTMMRKIYVHDSLFSFKMQDAVISKFSDKYGIAPAVLIEYAKLYSIYLD